MKVLSRLGRVLGTPDLFQLFHYIECGTAGTAQAVVPAVPEQVGTAGTTDTGGTDGGRFARRLS